MVFLGSAAALSGASLLQGTPALAGKSHADTSCCALDQQCSNHTHKHTLLRPESSVSQHIL